MERLPHLGAWNSSRTLRNARDKYGILNQNFGKSYFENVTRIGERIVTPLETLRELYASASVLEFQLLEYRPNRYVRILNGKATGKGICGPTLRNETRNRIDPGIELTLVLLKL